MINKQDKVRERLEEKLPALADQLRADYAASHRRKGARTVTRTTDGAQLTAAPRRQYSRSRCNGGRK